MIRCHCYLVLACKCCRLSLSQCIDSQNQTEYALRECALNNILGPDPGALKNSQISGLSPGRLTGDPISDCNVALLQLDGLLCKRAFPHGPSSFPTESVQTVKHSIAPSCISVRASVRSRTGSKGSLRLRWHSLITMGLPCLDA